MPVTDTIKVVTQGDVTTPNRQTLLAMQTPQAARAELLQRAHREVQSQFTDEMALLESIGISPTFVDGDEANFKVTRPADILRAQIYIGHSGPEVRSGIGYDIHPFSSDSTRKLWLGGVCFEDHVALHGHSDADVLLHAVTDALLGAVALGDIGLHFPNSDERWAGEPSLTFLNAAKDLLSKEGWQIVNVDATVIAATPKVMKRALDIRAAIGSALGLDIDRVSIKATTNEGLGSIGRSEGIAAFATATVRR
jgi:2-C-methyl-D-erythritol 4-phosphate cytidylyltransferase/2-C-methyl-D-erythritol 2,4-cyclodiphosphate synthase